MNTKEINKIYLKWYYFNMNFKEKGLKKHTTAKQESSLFKPSTYLYYYYCVNMYFLGRT